MKNIGCRGFSLHCCAEYVYECIYTHDNLIYSAVFAIKMTTDELAQTVCTVLYTHDFRAPEHVSSALPRKGMKNLRSVMQGNV